MFVDIDFELDAGPRTKTPESRDKGGYKGMTTLFNIVFIKGSINLFNVCLISLSKILGVVPRLTLPLHRTLQ